MTNNGSSNSITVFILGHRFPQYREVGIIGIGVCVTFIRDECQSRSNLLYDWN